MFEILIELLEMTPLMEMAYSRNEARRIILGIGGTLSNHIILLENGSENDAKNHWKSEVNAFLSDINDATYLTKGGRLKMRDLVQWAWRGPLGEYSDYTRRYEALVKKKQGIQLSPPSSKDWNSIKAKYDKAFNLIINHKTCPTYDDL